ncbi:MAG: glycogen/starch synthase [Muribaculaceae bacterium]|nr:glycogen/starch synthase [Muribaculaceae bacterium]
MDLNKVLFVSQEMAPYVSTGELGEFARLLPQSIQESGTEVRTFVPRYGIINERRNQLHEVIRLSGLNIEIDDTDHPLIIKVATLLPSRMQVYFIDSDDYFDRHNADGLETVLNPAENDERAIFFARGVLETVKKLRWTPSVVHCMGWISALTPMYLRSQYSEDPTLGGAKVVVSLLNDTFDTPLDPRITEKLKMDGFTEDHFGPIAESATHEALQRLAIDFADAIVVSHPDVPEQLVEYARNSGKPMLEYPGAENYTDAYRDFYLSL